MERKRPIALPMGPIVPTISDEPKRVRSRVTWNLAEVDTTAGTTPDKRDADARVPTDPGPSPTESNESILELLRRLDPTTGELRLPKLTKRIVRKLARGLEQIAEWYTLEFLEARGSQKADPDKKARLESKYGRRFLRRWTKWPLDGDIRAVYPVNYWHLRGKLHLLRWLLGQNLNRLTAFWWMERVLD